MKRARTDAAADTDAVNRLPERAREQIRTLMKAVCDTPLYRSSRKLNGQRGAALLAKMRTGAQTLDDFEDEHALWGYVNAVGSKRAFNVCETFAWLWAHLPPGPMSDTLTQMFARRPRRPLRVASLGGGPASCLLGWAVFERLVISGGDSDADATADAASAAPSALQPEPADAPSLAQRIAAGEVALSPVLDPSAPDYRPGSRYTGAADDESDQQDDDLLRRIPGVPHFAIHAVLACLLRAPPGSLHVRDPRDDGSEGYVEGAVDEVIGMTLGGSLSDEAEQLQLLWAVREQLRARPG